MYRRIKAWHFLQDDYRIQFGTKEKVKAGSLLVEHGKWGLHASRNLLDALTYAPGNILCRVELRGTIIESSDKLVASRRYVEWTLDATDLLREFARWCALQVIHLWDAPDIVKQYLETGDESIRAAARAAASAAAMDAANAAAWYAAMDAARDADWDAARAATRVAAWNAARNAARNAAWYAAWAAVCDAASATASDATRDAARDATMDAAWYAASAAAWAADWYATRDAARNTGSAAAKAAASAAQEKKLLSLIRNVPFEED